MNERGIAMIESATRDGKTHPPADRLEEIARRCRDGRPLNPCDSHWLAEAINSYLDKNVMSLEEALGLRYGRGGVPWWRERALRNRDAVLRKLSDRFFAEQSLCQRSREIATMASRYAACAWPRDRQKADMPEHYRGTPREYLWMAFESGATMPLSERQIRNILR
jgi:hypothetical protein